MKFERIVVATHGKFGEELLKSAEMIIGKQKDIKTCSYLEGMTLESFAKQVDEQIINGKTLICVDLFGGTPFNVARGLSQKKEFILLSGINLASMIEIAMNYSSMEMMQLVEYIKNIHNNSLRIFDKGEEK